MLDALYSLGPWHWLIAGLLLLGLEILAPGAFMLWLGLSALVVGALSFFVDIAWQAQAIGFVLLAVLLVLLFSRRLARSPQPEDGLFLNERASRTVGNVYPLVEAISHGVGRIRVEDGSWGVAGPDLPAGTLVRVTGHDGTLLTVVPA